MWRRRSGNFCKSSWNKSHPYRLWYGCFAVCGLFHQFIGQAQDLRGNALPLLLQRAVVQGIGHAHYQQTNHANDNARNEQLISPDHAAAHAGAQDQRADDAHDDGPLGGEELYQADMFRTIIL